MSWQKIQQGVRFQYFSPAYDYTGDLHAMHQGEDIHCIINDYGQIEQFKVPPYFDPALPIKLFTHGFDDSISSYYHHYYYQYYKEESRSDAGGLWFVKAWMKAHNNQVNVIMLDWSSIAKSIFLYFDYKYRAHDSIDVGNYLGRCLAKLSEETRVKARDIHLLGHSLGAHLVGKAGRVYKALTGQPLARITGLDPAWPFWTAGGCLLDLLNPLLGDAPLLRENKLSRESAAFVDVLHTDGDYQPCGTIMRGIGHLRPLGHSDFYASHGGRHQHGCGMLNYFWPHEKIIHGETCNHYRAVLYYLHRYGQY